MQTGLGSLLGILRTVSSEANSNHLLRELVRLVGIVSGNWMTPPEQLVCDGLMDRQHSPQELFSLLIGQVQTRPHQQFLLFIVRLR